MKAHVVDLATYRRTGKIVPPVQLVYDDVRVEFARRVEQRMDEMDSRPQKIADAFKAFAEAMAGNRPGDTE